MEVQNITTTLEKNTKELSMPLLCFDIDFKAVFTNEENLLAKMVSDITGIDYEVFRDNIILETNELPISTKNEKAKRCDFILKIGKDNLINLEINSSYYPGLLVKNLSYLCHLFSTFTKRGEEYNENMLAIQINLNCYDKNINKVLAKYQLQEVSTYEIYTKIISIFDVNVVKCNDLYYTLSDEDNIPNYIRWGALIYCEDFNKIPDIVKGIMTNEERDRIMDKMDKLTHDDLFMSELEARKLAEWEEKSKMTYARNQGIAEGIEFTIKNMVENKLSLEVISKVTGKSIEEITEIIEK